ncbi:hypothetical protein [Salinimicrobium terrae]|uniref:hypothetical protein n=1 Tax=Salinimicrobium terrae TaxID=470866 RepID=UPI000407862C|nr:hypothetical protein [Salinimicrobium terrae]
MIITFGCGSTIETRTMKPVVRAAVDAPEKFEAVAGTTLSDQACNSPLIDPRDDTEILIRSSFKQGVADYEVPNGKYGVEAGEFLRIDCATGEIRGIVRK